MEKHRRRRICLPLLFLSLSQLFFSPPALASTLPSHGCYWTESCQNKWIGGCGSGHVIIDQSDDCNGLCSAPKYPPCIPFYTHFHCCKPESPKVTHKCTKCRKKIDFGDEYICCTDCSDPYLTEKNTKLGYCKTGAELAVQLKPSEVFQWIAGPWMKCSSPCDGGVRYRDVGCFGSIEGMPVTPYPVDDTKCSDNEMPTTQGSCNLRSCDDFSDDTLNTSNHGRASAWLITFVVLLGLAAVGGLGFAGYTYYKRRTTSNSGFVYIMLEGYS